MKQDLTWHKLLALQVKLIIGRPPAWDSPAHSLWVWTWDHLVPGFQKELYQWAIILWKAFQIFFCLFVGCEGGVGGGHIYDHCTSLLLQSMGLGFRVYFISTQVYLTHVSWAEDYYCRTYIRKTIFCCTIDFTPSTDFFERQKL